MYIDYNMKLLIIARIFYYNKKINYLKKLYIIYTINKLVKRYNNNYINRIKREIILDKKYDNEQLEAIYSQELNTFVIAGAGAGKTSLIVGKINYLIENLNYKEKDILCISYTNEACNNLKEKLKYNVDIFTFHKLALNILNGKYRINNNYLKYVIDEYFESIIYNNNMIKVALKIIKKQNIKKYKYYLKNEYFKEIKEIIYDYINLFIINGFSYKYFLKYKNNKKLISIIIDIYKLYISELDASNEVDLNTLILKASKYVDKKIKYKYIIIDEFQDISKIRLDFVKKIISNTNAKILTVGDDYQSIYKFSGSSLESFIGYKKENTKVIKLKNNYRCCQEIVYVSNKFICKNKEQIIKKIKAHKSIKKCIVLIKYSKEILYKLLIYLCKKNKNILILGRNRNDINNYINIDKIDLISEKYNKKIRYKTVHAAKGLEEDAVIIINLKSSINGFPNKIRNNYLIDSLMSKEKYLYAEERRLFYVALTRSNDKTYIIEHDNQSIFLKEIKKIGKNNISYLSLE